ncbi:hypothetical protein GOODEAATRI_010687 [Goodea atripinnis]|uniref:Uncharacterized protein n=1 Tax=Goodea atripinnis TaxID=208336 RepID=A0ABV0MJN0_9TELE
MNEHKADSPPTNSLFPDLSREQSDNNRKKKACAFPTLVRKCVSTTALHHIQNKLANLNVSKMSLHQKSLAFSKQSTHAAVSAQHGTIHPEHKAHRKSYLLCPQVEGFNHI